MHIFSCEHGEYDVCQLWELAPEPKIVPVECIKGLNDDVWGIGLTVRQLAKQQSGKYWQQAVQADLSFPLIITPNGYLADGNHRMAVFLADDMKFILASRFDSWDSMNPALLKKS